MNHKMSLLASFWWIFRLHEKPWQMRHIWGSNPWKTTKNRLEIIASGVLKVCKKSMKEKKWYVNETCQVYVALWDFTFGIKF